MEVARRSDEAAMPEKTLYQSDLHPALDKVGSKGMAQNVDAALAGNSALFNSPVVDVLARGLAHVLGGILPEEEPRSL